MLVAYIVRLPRGRLVGGDGQSGGESNKHLKSSCIGLPEVNECPLLVWSFDHAVLASVDLVYRHRQRLFLCPRRGKRRGFLISGLIFNVDFTMTV